MTQRNDWQLGDPLDRSDTFAGASVAKSGVEPENASATSARRGKREMRIPVCLKVEIRDQFGGREQARTQFVMVRGAVLTTSSQVRLGHKVTLHNPKNGKSAECHVIGLERDPKNANQVFVANTIMLRSDDGGAHFIPTKGDPTGDDFHTLWIDPKNPDRRILGVDQGTLVTINGGRTWSSETRPTSPTPWPGWGDSG